MRSKSGSQNRPGRLSIALLVLLAVAFVFGGASRLHELRLAVVEIAALPLLVFAVITLQWDEAAPRHQFALTILGALVLLPLIQIIPLPPQVWSGLPGRQDGIEALNLAGLTPGWTSLSLTPDKTWRSWLALIPPVATFLAILACSGQDRSRFALALLIGATAAMLLGAAQFLSGSERFYFWATTAAGNVVGFFANRNHLATLCLVCMPIAAVLGAGALRRGSQREHALPWLMSFFVVLAVLTIGIARSRAGVVLVGPTLAASLLAAWVGTGRGWPRPIVVAGLGAGSVVMIAIAIFAFAPVMERFDTVGAKEGRFENWPTVLQAADAYLPLGSGLGSFDSVFRSVEPLALLDATFFNQAHNEYLETWLETGWLGAFLVIAFLVWFGRRSWAAWRGGISSDRDLQRAASIGIFAILAHSAVDYPLRTETMAVVFAFLCAVLEMAGVSSASLSESHGERKQRRRVSVRPS